MTITSAMMTTMTTANEVDDDDDDGNDDDGDDDGVDQDGHDDGDDDGHDDGDDYGDDFQYFQCVLQRTMHYNLPSTTYKILHISLMFEQCARSVLHPFRPFVFFACIDLNKLYASHSFLPSSMKNVPCLDDQSKLNEEVGVGEQVVGEE